jgi:hypothetical protein
MCRVPPFKKIGDSDALAMARRFTRDKLAHRNGPIDVRRRQRHSFGARCRAKGDRKNAFHTRSRHGIAPRFKDQKIGDWPAWITRDGNEILAEKGVLPNPPLRQ